VVLTIAASESEGRTAAKAKQVPPQGFKDCLVKLFHGKCAYCESKIMHVDYGHIEHYRPKSGPFGRPDLTFDWNNLLLACGICNGSAHKGDRFPGADAGGPIVNPCDEEPGDHFEFQYDHVAHLASVYGKTERGRLTETLLGLNRKDLRIHRSRFVMKLAVLFLLSASDPTARELIEESTRDDA
jgi:uncharacterized protein (TIGR02646 family)